MTLNAPRNARIEILKRRIAKRHAELLEETREDVVRARERCIECGAEIAFKRLAVYPVATRCAECQHGYERMFVHPGAPAL